MNSPNIYNGLIFASVFSIFTSIFCAIAPDLVFSSGIDDQVIDSTDAQTKSSNDTKRVALIQKNFTHAAYQNGSFYNFYGLYSPGQFDRTAAGLNTTVTENLDMLKDRPIPDGPFPYYSHPTYLDEPYIRYFYLIHDLAKRNNTVVTNLTDMDVDQGKIFNADGTNAYDVLFLFHNEYVTQAEYDNLKKFVTNGGTIVFTEGNVLYAEVKYNSTSNTISLVKGHDWEFDGKSAKNSVGERWVEENKEWMGSNFLEIPSSNENVYFKNNPFNYTHAEEQYVTNPNAKILIDYKASNLTEEYRNATVATYMMNYGEGKVINLGIWGHRLVDNEEFVNYLDKVIIPIAYDLDINNNISITSVPFIRNDCIDYNHRSNMITVDCNSNLPEMYQVINNSNVLDKESQGVWILNASIRINPTASLTINNTDSSWLKIINKGDREPNFISVYGGAIIDGIKITSWDPYSNDTIKQNVNGSIPRPYIVFNNADGNVNISNSEIAFLGNNSYPSNGLVFVGGGSKSLLVNNTIHDMWDGFSSHSAEFIKIIKNEFYNNNRSGIDTRSGSHDLDIIGNLAYNNSKMGIICAGNCYNILFDRNVVHDNGIAGLMFSRNTTNSTAINNYAYNEKVGISIYSSSNNTVYDNLLKSSDKGIFIGENSSHNLIFNNSLVNDTIGIDVSNFAKDNVLKNNIISNVIINSDQAHESMNKKVSIYGCESIDDSEYLHCDPFKSEFEGNSTYYNSTKIMDITRDPFYVDGTSGKAIEFIDRYREYIEIPQSNLYNSSEISVSFWVKETERSKQASPFAHVISHVSVNDKNGWYFDHSSDDQSIRFVVSDTSGDMTTSNSIPISNTSFTHIAATFDGSQMQVYRNGSQFQILDYFGNYSSAFNLPIHIGSASYCNSCMRFNGIIDDVNLFNRTISDSEIKQLYLGIQNNTGATNTTTSSNSYVNKDLVGHWSFDNTLDDLSIYKNKAQMFTLLSSMASTPDDRIFISEKNTGKVKIMKDGKLLEKPFAVLNDYYVGWEQGLLGLAIDPEFAKNHFVYLYYTSVSAKDNSPVNKVVRFTEKDNVAVNTTVLLDNIPASNGYHAGGALAIGPDGKLYVTVGDATVHIYAQSNDILVGKILRINTDGTIPSDNPFPNSPVYTLGHRNMFGIAFDDKQNIGIVTENGDARYDEINLIEKGGNYGFPTMQIPNISPELSNSTLDIKPLRSYWETPSPTQALFYTGDKYPSLKDNFLFGTYTGDIYAVHIDNASETIDSEEHIEINNSPFEAATGITQTSNGNIYYGTNHIYKLDSVSKGEDPYQVLYPITITRSENIVIDGIFPKIGTSVTIDLHSTPYVSETNSTQYLKLKMPKSIIDEIGNVTYSVTSQNQNQNQSLQKTMPFSWVDLDSKYSEVTIPIPLKFNIDIATIRIIINSNDSNIA